MASLLSLLSQHSNTLQTRRGLILLGLQNDFLSHDGKLPSRPESDFQDRLEVLVPAFRQFGSVIWVRSEFEANRKVNSANGGDTVILSTGTKRAALSPTTTRESSLTDDDRPASSNNIDDELFLTRTADREPCCVRGTYGAKFAANVQTLIEKKDMQVVKTYYSAFGSTSLLLTLRSELITELYIAGCTTNLSVFATAMDAARYGIKIILIEDCLGYRKKDRHDEAVRQLVEVMDAGVMTSEVVIETLHNPVAEEYTSDGDEDAESGAGGDELQTDREPESKKRSFEATKSPADCTTLAVDSESEDYDTVLPPAQVRHSADYAVPSNLMHPHSPHLAHHAVPSSTKPADPSAASSVHAKTDCKSSPASHDCRLSPAEDDSQDESFIRRAPVRCKLSSVGGTRKDTKAATLPVRNYQRKSATSPKLVHRDPRSTSGSKIESQVNMNTATPNSDPTASPRSYRPLFGCSHVSDSANSTLHLGLLPNPLASTIFALINNEITWQSMHHLTGTVPRLVSCQGTMDISDRSRPVYRHPSDRTLSVIPWTPNVDIVRQAAEQVVGHELNHALIQLYRGGTDFISEHSDKTLDIVPDSKIVNVSFGAQRTMRFRTKRAAQPSSPAGKGTLAPRTTHRVALPHNSLLALSLETNAEYLHAINADKRPACELSEAEIAYDGQRISLTFRCIGTFLDETESRIHGQGATGKSRDQAHSVINNDPEGSELLVRAFGKENQGSEVSWADIYGQGSDVLHLRANA